jgi:hypothetical protein
MDLSFKEVGKGLQDLFSFAYKENAEIETEELTQDDLDTLADLDSLEILENFKDLVIDLLNNKRELKTTDKADLLVRNEKFEAMI